MELLAQRVAQRRQQQLGSSGFSDRVRHEAQPPGPVAAPCVQEKPEDGYDTQPKILPILTYPHPALRRPNAEVQHFDGRLRQLASNLFRTMYDADDGVGLAAPQVGVNLRLMVYNPRRGSRNVDPSGEEVLVNPRIVASGGDSDTTVESCLSFPGLRGEVARPEWVEVESFDLEGRFWRRRLEGLEARLFQHEYDHLDGVLFVDRLAPQERSAAQPSLDSLSDAYAAAGGSGPAP